jgi:hypothetical protein
MAHTTSTSYPVVNRSRTEAVPRRGLLSPKTATLLICLVGVGLIALLLAANAARPGGRPIIHMACCFDAPSYFSTGHALLFRQSFDLSGEFQRLGLPFETWPHSFEPDGQFVSPETGRPASVFAIGYSILEIPFLAAGTGMDALTHHPADGYGQFALTFYYIANIVFLTIGLVCLYWFLYALGEYLPISERSRTWVPLLAVIAIIPTTTLGFYAFSPLAHECGFMMLSILVLFWWQSRNSSQAWRWALLGVVAGFVALCRWQDAIYMAGPPLCELLHLFRTRKLPEGISIQKWLGVRALYCVVAFATLTPQLIEWKAIFGHYLLVPQGSGFFVFPPHYVQNVLFSTQHGWFVWTPVTLFCVIGLFMAWFKFEGYLVPWILLVFTEILLMGAQPTDWHCNESFSIRSLTCSLAVAAIGLAIFVWATPARWTPVVWSLIVFFGVYSTLFAAQYRLDLLPKNDRLLASELIHDKLFMRQAYARSRSAQRGAELIQTGDAAGATVSLNRSLAQYGDDRSLLKTLQEAYTAEGNIPAAEETQERLQKLLARRLF